MKAEIMYSPLLLFPQTMSHTDGSTDLKSTTSTWGIIILYVTFRWSATNKSIHLGVKQPVQNAILAHKLFFVQG